MRLTVGFIVMITMYLLSVFAVHAESISVQLKEDVHLSGSEICLGDIAFIQGENDMLVSALREISIAQVPQTETGQRSISTSEIMLHMRKIGLEESEISFSGPPVATIYPEVQTISGQHLFDVVSVFIQDTMPWDPNDVIIHPKRLPDEVEVVNGDVSYDIIPLSRNQYIGPSRYTVVVNVDGQIQKNIDIFVDITVFKEILVASSKINRGDMIQPHNVMISRKELRSSTQDAISDPSQALGMVAARNISPQAVIKPSYITMPVIVQRKDMVKISFKSGGLLVQGVGVAKENGSIGDYIKVQNVDSEKIIFAKVVGVREVSVDANDGGAI